MTDLYKKFKFDKKIISFREPVNNQALCISNSKYKEYDVDSKKLIKYINDHDDSNYFVNIYRDLYVAINPKFFTKIKKFDISSDIYLCNINNEKELCNSCDMIYTRKNKLKMSTIFERFMWKPVINNLEDGNLYKCKTFVTVNGKNNKIPIKDFYKKYFNN